MQNTETIKMVETYVRDHWFKMAMIIMVIILFMKKDLSVSLRLNNPNKMEEQLAPPPEHQEKTPIANKPANFSEKRGVVKAGATTMMDLLPSISLTENGKSKKEEWANLSEELSLKYIKRFAKVAVNERKKYGIPASIIIANALLHSACGTRDMAKAGNNHFALPCTSNWKGDSGTYDDACYRHYPNAWTSFRDHSLYLTTGSTAYLVNLGNKDYKAWAKEMEKVAIFEIDGLADKLISIIEYYSLYELDE
ncbi:MAG TPA: hypothetical protein ENJ45_00280 [Phaeodactylibacter sp.]|nr:hypothetical protein [Phaeodactylibacter sp.]